MNTVGRTLGLCTADPRGDAEAVDQIVVFHPEGTAPSYMRGVAKVNTGPRSAGSDRFTSMRRLEVAVDGAAADVEDAGDLGDGVLALVIELAEQGGLVGVECAPASTVAAAGSGCLQTGAGAFPPATRHSIPAAALPVR